MQKWTINVWGLVCRLWCPGIRINRRIMM
jgi:hypothetical protein